MKKHIKFLALVLTLAMSLSILTACSSGSSAGTSASPEESSTPEASSGYTGGSYTLKLSNGSSKDGKIGQAVEAFAEAISERTDGKCTVTCFHSGELGGEREVEEACALGSIDMFFNGLGSLAAFYDPMQINNAPYLFNSREQCWKFWDGELGQELADGLLEASGLRVMGYGENGLRCFTNNTRPLTSPADFVGLKFRVQENPIHISMVECLGGSATPMSLTEVYTSLQQGVVDGQENPVTNFIEYKFPEVQHYYTVDNHTYDALALCINNDVYEGFDDEFKAIFDEECANCVQNERQLSKDLSDQAYEDLESVYDVEVYELSDEEHQAFVDCMGPAYEIVKQYTGADFWAKVEKFLAES